MAKKNWIKGAIKHPGALRRKAKRMGKTVKGLVANPPKNASTTTKKQIALARTLMKMRHSRRG